MATKKKKKAKKAPAKKAAKRKTGKQLYTRDYQHGRSNPLYDKARKAKPGGKRESPEGGIYYEYRKNRTDKKGSLTGYIADNGELYRVQSKILALDKEMQTLSEQIRHAKTQDAKQALKLVMRTIKLQYTAIKKHLRKMKHMTPEQARKYANK